eukprot:GHRR01006215.1.p1 GENE.GHRR01006215.1~~GHRR01006215.1.p1  ORF type:complete len:372 (+),score=206.07 GHRR01006215.1:184-1299(+)
MQVSCCHLTRCQSRAASPVSHRTQQVPRSQLCRAARREIDGGQQQPQLMQQLAAVAATTAVSIAAMANPLPAMAELVQTVPVSQVTQMAKPLPKQKISKGKVWTAFIGGAASLFLVTVAAENNKSWFPAIGRANDAMAKARNRPPQDEQESSDIETTATPSMPQQQATLPDGLPPLDIESAALEAEIERRTALLEAEEAERREVERQSAVVAEGLLTAKKKVLGAEEINARYRASSSSSNSNTEAESTTAAAAGVAAAAAAEAGAELAAAAAAEAASRNAANATNSSDTNGGGSSNGGHGSSTTNAGATGYTVVSDADSMQEEVAWQSDEDDGKPQDSKQTTAAFAGILDSRKAMQQYRQQQQQQQQEVRQ